MSKALPEDADDDEGNALDADRFSDCGLIVAIELLRERLHDDSDLLMGEFVLIVEETSGNNDEIAHDTILRRDAQQHRLLRDAAAKTHVIVKLQHGRRGDDARNLVEDSAHVVERHVVGRAGVVGTTDVAATILQLDLVRSDARQLIQRILFSSRSERRDKNDGGRADDHTQHGEQKPRLAGAEAVHRKP